VNCTRLCTSCTNNIYVAYLQVQTILVFANSCAFCTAIANSINPFLFKTHSSPKLQILPLSTSTKATCSTWIAVFPAIVFPTSSKRRLPCCAVWTFAPISIASEHYVLGMSSQRHSPNLLLPIGVTQITL
jgi:hypothetical protein